MFIFSNEGSFSYLLHSFIAFCLAIQITLALKKMGVLASQMTIDYPINLANEINKLLDNLVILSQFCPIFSDYNPDFMTYVLYSYNRNMLKWCF